MLIRSRREFLRDALRSVAAVGAVGTMSKFGEMNALAAGGGYQAMVCIFLAGGNDGHNTVIPIATPSLSQDYNTYKNARQALAIPQAQLSVINNGTDVYGLHPALPEIQALYNSGKAAVLANVGMLVTKINRAQYLTNNSAIVPNALFSHSDQQGQWQSSVPTGLGSTGWGGRMADVVASMNSAAVYPAMTSVSGSSLFCNGQSTFAASVTPGGVALLNGMNNPAKKNGMQQLLTFDNGMQLVQAANGALGRGTAYANTLSGLLANAKLTTTFAGDPLSAQLATVAKIISVRAQLGLSRQIFFCQLGGFDTHGDQMNIQNQLLPMLSKGISSFYQATQELGVDQNVVTFTASEFGRTLTPNSNLGSDHAWGSHHFVVGGGVQGGKFFGQYPSLALGGQDDANTRGTLIPSTSVDQYGATLAQWFGVSPGANLNTIFPNIGNFQISNLGILG